MPTIYIRNSKSAQAQPVDVDDLDKISKATEYVVARDCTALTSLNAPAAAKYVVARDCTALTSLDARAAKYVDVRDCTALTSLNAPAANAVFASGCTALTSLNAPAAAKYVVVRDCTALTSLNAPAAAKYVVARDCTALTSLNAPAANAVFASDCPALTSLDARAAKYVDVRDCPALTSLNAKAAKQIIILPNEHETFADLKTWREEMADAWKLFKEADPQLGDWCLWIHHEVSFERLYEPWQNRFDFIAREKPESERAWRFRMIRPLAADVIRALGIVID